MKQNTIVFLETGSGKTLIASMLLRSYAAVLRKPSPFVAVFLVPKDVLVSQQAKALEKDTGLKVGTYSGGTQTDFWNSNMWKQAIEKNEVLVMTPEILLNSLRHAFFKFSVIKGLVFDECHHARGNHPYALIMKEFYYRHLQSGESNLPRILGMTASLTKSKGGNSNLEIDLKEIRELERVMNAKVYTCVSESVLAEFIPFPTLTFKFYEQMDSQHPFSTNLADQLRILREQLDPKWSIGVNTIHDMDEGLLTAKVVCLIELLTCDSKYRSLEDLRCIVFAEMIVTAVIIESLLSELLPRHNSWKTKYIAGSNKFFHSQTRKTHNSIIDEFREGKVNIIVATPILEEGLDVQSCNLVICFDPPKTFCSFIQCRGRARTHNSDFIIMVESGDLNTQSRLEKYCERGDIMRKEFLCQSSLPCISLETDFSEGKFYCVESTGAIVTLNSSISLIEFYCSRLPSDKYSKPTPRWDDKTQTLYLPNDLIQEVHAEGNAKILKQIACFEACKKLHKMGALTDNLVPNTVVREDEESDLESQPYEDAHPRYIPSEMVGSFCPDGDAHTLYYCYLLELKQEFEYDIPVHNILLGTRNELEVDGGNTHFDLKVGSGSLIVNLKYVGVKKCYSSEEVLVSRRFQVTLFRVLVYQNFNYVREVSSQHHLQEDIEIDYLILPATILNPRDLMVKWESTISALFSFEKCNENHTTRCLVKNYFNRTHTKNGIVCTCKLKNSLVYTPHNGNIYWIADILSDMNGNSALKLWGGGVTTYKKFNEQKHGINLKFCDQPLLEAREPFLVENYLLEYRQAKQKVIPATKVLEAITTKKCEEKYCLETLETLGDSFLKYAVSQQLFKTYQNHREGDLTRKRKKLISNESLCKRGCEHKLMGFIRNERFDPKMWSIPGDGFARNALQEDFLPNMTTVYISGRREVGYKTVADVVEALIGALLTTGGELPALKFMSLIGMEVDFNQVPYETHISMHSEKLVRIRQNLSCLESKLYSFHDPSLLVEALKHGSYKLQEIPRSYQRLEFLGDAVLDYLISKHLYDEHPDQMLPGLLTDMRSASVNNECYARCAVKAGLHEHILRDSRELDNNIVATVNNFGKLSSESIFGWESETYFTEVLADFIESVAGAIFIDSGYNKDIVFQSIRPLLEPFVTPKTLKLNPTRELRELCTKKGFPTNQSKKCENGAYSTTVEVEANGSTFKGMSMVSGKDLRERIASRIVLRSLKETLCLE
ncbi:endoribonuclease Dicer homolog 2 isoform X2 [Morus notabilis]|nr:endoribonuclease Dicer homolog 2 isoform X2 [Morus notabilis]